MSGQLDARDLAELRAVLAPFADRIDLVGLFGSRGTGHARVNSDIDLVLYGDLRPEDVDRLWTLFDESGISVTVDPLHYSDDLYPPLKRHIDRSMRPLFDKSALLRPAAAAHD